MAKTYIHTCDIFDEKSRKDRIDHYKFCYRKALKCGLTCKCFIDVDEPRLELSGTKRQFVKYYWLTLLKTDYKIGGIKRLTKFLFL